MTVHQRWLGVILFGATLWSFSPAIAADEKSATELPEATKVVVEIRPTGKDNKHQIVVVAEEELSSPAIQVYLTQWDSLESHGTEDGKFVYGTKQTYDFSVNRLIKLSHWLDKGNFQAVSSIKYPSTETVVKTNIPLTLQSSTVFTREAYETAKKEAAKKPVQQQQAAANTGNALLDAVNAHRARSGLHPFAHNQNLYNISGNNNAGGGGHNYTGGRPQIWAGSGNIHSAINMWMSPKYYHSHGVMLMGGYREAGVHCSGGHCTITF